MIPLLPDTGNVETSMAIIYVIVAGILGALVREIIDNKGLRLPKIFEGVLNLGFVGGILIGGISGYYLGGSLVGAFTAGLSANAIIQGLITRDVK